MDKDCKTCKWSLKNDSCKLPCYECKHSIYLDEEYICKCCECVRYDLWEECDDN